MSIAIVGAYLIDGTGKAPLEDATILIKDKKITEVGKSNTISIPSGVEKIDAGGMTVMPGMMDLHVHLGAITSDPNEPAIDKATWKASNQLRTMYAYRDSLKYMEAGFTTVRDPGGWDFVIGVKRAISHGIVKGPRIIGYKSVNETGADENRKKVREAIIDIGVDGIKTMTSGSVSGYIEDITWRRKTFNEMLAICDESHALGNTRVATHSYAAHTVRLAVEAGVDTVEHGPFISDDPDLVTLMKEKGTFWVPTIIVYSKRGLLDPNKKWIPEIRRKKAKRAWDNGEKNFKILHDAGVKIAMGTDAARHFYHHGDNAWELEHYVKYGMTPMEAIVSTTKTTAKALGEPWASTLGLIKSGKIADIIIVDGNPLKDITNLQDSQRIKKVIKEGVIVAER